jgi:hypothetical protein
LCIGVVIETRVVCVVFFSISEWSLWCRVIIHLSCLLHVLCCSIPNELSLLCVCNRQIRDIHSVGADLTKHIVGVNLYVMSINYALRSVASIRT